MIRLNSYSRHQSPWLILLCLVSSLGVSGCADMSAFTEGLDTIESEEFAAEETTTEPTPAPSIQDVQEAISSTKALLDDQQKQIGQVLSLRGEVKQTLREFRDQNLEPMNATIDTLQYQVAGWENTSATNQAELSSKIDKLAQDLMQAQTRVGVYGEQVTALVDQIDQNNRQYEKLLTEFQQSLIGFKGAMGEFTVTLTAEQDRATQEEAALANQLKGQQLALDQAMPTAKEILEIQKRLNQLHTYINQVRNTVTADTTELQAATKNEATDNLRDLITSLEQRYQQLADASSSNASISANLQALEQRMTQSEKRNTETVKALHEDIQEISVTRPDDDQTKETEQLKALVTSLEQRYQQLAQAPPSNSVPTEHLQALEQRVEQTEQHSTKTMQTLQEDIQKISVAMQASDKTQEMESLQAVVISLEQRFQQLAKIPLSNSSFTKHLQDLEHRVELSEKHYSETVKSLHKDIQELSVGMQASINTQETDNLQDLVASLEQRYQQLTRATSPHSEFTKHLQALEQRVEQSEIHSATTIKALQHDLQTVSERMTTLTQSIGAETVEALHHDIQEVSAGMQKLAQSISYLEQTKIQTTPIQAGSITTPRDQP